METILPVRHVAEGPLHRAHLPEDCPILSGPGVLGPEDVFPHHHAAPVEPRQLELAAMVTVPAPHDKLHVARLEPLVTQYMGLLVVGRPLRPGHAVLCDLFQGDQVFGHQRNREGILLECSEDEVEASLIVSRKMPSAPTAETMSRSEPTSPLGSLPRTDVPGVEGEDGAGLHDVAFLHQLSEPSLNPLAVGDRSRTGCGRRNRCVDKRATTRQRQGLQT